MCAVVGLQEQVWEPLFYFTLKLEEVSYCDEWGGAESRGNGARPVE